MSETMQDRWIKFMDELGFTGNVLAQDAVKVAVSFAEIEVRLALEPSEQSKELDDRAMTQLRLVCPAGWSEVVKVRAENARLRGELEAAEAVPAQHEDRATLELWDRGESAAAVLGQEQYGGYADAEDAGGDLDDGEHVYRITVTAERVDETGTAAKAKETR